MVFNFFEIFIDGNNFPEIDFMKNNFLEEGLYIVQKTTPFHQNWKLVMGGFVLLADTKFVIEDVLNKLKEVMKKQGVSIILNDIKKDITVEESFILNNAL